MNRHWLLVWAAGALFLAAFVLAVVKGGGVMVDNVDAVVAVPVAVLLIVGVVWQRRHALAVWLGCGRGR